MPENPYRSPESDPRTEKPSEEPSGLSWKGIWGAFSGWGSLLLLLALLDAASVWAAGARKRLIILMSGVGILVVGAVVWRLRRTR